MGQRLVLSFYESMDDDYEEDCLLNVYYHWGAYTRAVAEICSDFISEYESIQHTGNRVYDILTALESTGARVLENDQEFVKTHYNFNPNVDELDRNRGLIAVSPDQIASNQSYSEGDASIYMKEEVINNGCCSFYGNRQDYLYELGMNEDDDASREKMEDVEIPKVDIWMEGTDFNDIQKVMLTMTNMANNSVYVFECNEGYIVGMCE